MKELHLIKEDFIGTEYADCNMCAVEKAYFRVTGNQMWETPIKLYSSEISYNHDLYGIMLFREDKAKAELANDGDIIRTIILTKNKK